MRTATIAFTGVGAIRVCEYSDCVVVELVDDPPRDPTPGFDTETKIVISGRGPAAPPKLEIERC